MEKLLFICSQNRLRSPTAEAVFSESEGLEVESAGINMILCAKARLQTYQN